jgi:hypothetical protein
MTRAWNQAVVPWKGDDPRHAFDKLSRSLTASLPHAVVPWKGDDPRHAFDNSAARRRRYSSYGRRSI